jgi:ubiquinone/menaquinone biosynthesis C-methylase UbiE
MNEQHVKLCPSPEWAEHIQGEVLPSLAALAPLGDELLELGPGPGAATEWLRHRVRRLVAVESDPGAAARLMERFAGTNVEVVLGDATELECADDAFDVVGAFTMLHHVPTVQLQHRLLAEAYRVLRPGGAFLCSDSLASTGLHHFHEGDTYNPVDPAGLLVQLRSLGFTNTTLVVDDDLRLATHKPTDASEWCPSAPDAD